MSCRNWLHNAAIGGWLITAIVGLLVWSGYEYRETRNEARYVAYQQRQTNSPCAPVTSRSQQPRAQEEATALGEKPNQGPATDICQQWRMAVAAERQADLTETLLHVTVVEIVALLLTLAATAWAAFSANRAVKITRDQFFASQRPWIKINKIELAGPVHINEHGIRCNLIFHFENVGSSPAEKIWPTVKIYAGNQMNLAAREHHLLPAAGSDLMGKTVFPGGKEDEKGERKPPSETLDLRANAVSRPS